jgi:hypothetical protein
MSEHFIPFRRADILETLAADARLADADRAAFARACRLLTGLFHHEFHQRLEELKAAFAPIDPNRAAAPVPGAPAVDAAASRTRLWIAFRGLLERANFHAVGEAELNQALTQESVFEVKLHTRLDDFAELMIFARGRRSRPETVKRRLGLARATLDVDYYERVVLCLRFQDAAHFAREPKRKVPFVPGSTTIKLFENVPVADLEMIFPNSEVRMRLKDHVMLWVPAIVGGVLVLLKAGVGIAAVALTLWLLLRSGGGDHQMGAKEWAAISAGCIGMFAIGGFVVRQWGRFKNKKIAFMKSLAESLYFKNLDNNAGVFHRLIDDAEEEEVKEAALAWFFLLVDGPASEPELDRTVETWFRERLGRAVDFEVDDALGKLERLGLATREGERWSALAPGTAATLLESRWNALAVE